MARSRRIGAVWALALATAAQGATRRAAAEAVALDFEAPPGCAERDQFAEHLSRRSPRLVLDPRAARRVRVEVYRDPFESVGTLQLTEADGAEANRRVEASSCEEVVTALALVTAVALEEHQPEQSPQDLASATHEPAAGRQAIEASATGAPAADNEQLGQGSEAIGGEETASDGVLVASAEDYAFPVYDAPADPWRAALGPPGPRGWWGLGFQLGVVGGVLPSGALAPRLFVDARLERSGRFTPAFRLSATRVVATEDIVRSSGTPSFGQASNGERSAHLTWTAGRADICPVSFPLGDSTAALWPCATAEGGWVDVHRPPSGSGDGSRPRGDGRHLWLAFGSVARLQWIVHDVLLVEVETGAELPLARPGATALYRPAALAAYVSGGVGGRFP